ncbi:PAAR domain-containing protein [Massilia sp. LXY-6]|uniref:PAAR domain-containing protein n=1 Tax=Massilia sp. LXY-6 TaxID=3379823 RepID=UPI003EE0229B
MSLKIITVGDKTDHGGTVISGSPNHDIRGKAIARLGDKVDCPQPYPGGKPHGVNKIITAHDTLTVDGVPVAVEGCTTECGCKLIGSLPATVG